MAFTYPTGYPLLWCPGWMTGGTISATLAVQYANTFDLMVWGGQFQPYLASMRSANPNIMLCQYQNATWMGTAKGVSAGTPPSPAYPGNGTDPKQYEYTGANYTGSKINAQQWPTTYLRDAGYVPWQQWLANACAALSGSGANEYDSIFLDVCGFASISPGYMNGVPVESPADPHPGALLSLTSNGAQARADWKTCVKAMLAVVRANGGPFTSMTCNGLESGSGYYGSPSPSYIIDSGMADYGMCEQFLRGPNDGILQWPSATEIADSITMLEDAETNKGKAVVTVTKIWKPTTNGVLDHPTQAQLDQWGNLTLACFLLGTQGRSMMSFMQDRNSGTVFNPPSYITGVNIGTPTQTHQVDAGTGIYYRQYTSGIVLCNADTASHTLSPIPGGPYIVNGVSATSVTMPAHTGLVLTRASGGGHTLVLSNLLTTATHEPKDSAYAGVVATVTDSTDSTQKSTAYSATIDPGDGSGPLPATVTKVSAGVFNLAFQTPHAWTWTPDGTYTKSYALTVAVTYNGAGGGSTSGTAHITVDTPLPTEIGLNPNGGPSSVVTQTTITGKYLSGATGVFYQPVDGTGGGATLSGALAAGATITSLPVAALPSSIASGSVILLDPQSSSGVDAVVTTALANAGATSVPVKSTTLQNAHSIGAPLVVCEQATGVAGINDTTIQANMPAQPGFGGTSSTMVVTPVGVSHPAGTNDDFTWNLAVPVSVTGLSPAIGSSLGGEQVKITGSGFQTGGSGSGTSAVVWLGADGVSYPAQSYQVVDDGTINAVAPAMPDQLANVLVTAGGVTSTAGASNSFTVGTTVNPNAPVAAQIITGRAKNASGNPLPGAIVSLTLCDFPAGFAPSVGQGAASVLIRAETTQADSNGNYTIAVVSNDDIDVNGSGNTGSNYLVNEDLIGGTAPPFKVHVPDTGGPFTMDSLRV